MQVESNQMLLMMQNGKKKKWNGEENLDNSIGKLEDIEKTIDGIKDDMHDKYYYWLG